MKKSIKAISIILMIILCISQVAITSMPNNNETKEWTSKQEKAHHIAETARELGLPESDPIIVRASELWNEASYIQYYTDDDAIMMAKVFGVECKGMTSVTEIANVGWIILNRVDAGCADGTIKGVITSKNQFAYRSKTVVTDFYLTIAYDVLSRWQRERNGEIDVGRTLPNNFYAFGGDGYHNYFRHSYYDWSVIWDYSLPSPYAS